MKEHISYENCLKMTRDGYVPNGDGPHYVIDSKNGIPYLADYLLYDEECWCATAEDWRNFYTLDKNIKQLKEQTAADTYYGELYSNARAAAMSGHGSQSNALLAEYYFENGINWANAHPSKEAVAIVLKHIESLRNMVSNDMFEYWVNKIYSEIYNNK